MRLVRSAIVGAVAVEMFDNSFRTDPMFFACLIGILNWLAILASAAPPSSAENSDTDASFATVSVNEDRFSTPLMPSCPPISPMFASSFALFGIFEDISTKRSPSFLISASVMPDVFCTPIIASWKSPATFIVAATPPNIAAPEPIMPMPA